MKIKNVGIFWGAILNLFVQVVVLIRGLQDGIYDVGGVSAVGGWVIVIYLCIEL